MDSATYKWFSWVLDKNLILPMILFLLMFLFVPWGGICYVLLIRIELVVCMRALVCRYVSGYKNRYQNFIRYLRELGDEVRGWKKDLHACSFLESMCVCSTSCWFLGRNLGSIGRKEEVRPNCPFMSVWSFWDLYPSQSALQQNCFKLSVILTYFLTLCCLLGFAGPGCHNAHWSA